MPDTPDPRFSLANERTYLAWLRTALAVLAGALVAAKAVTFHHALVRWAIWGPGFVAAGAMAAHAPRRWRRYERALREDRPLPLGTALGPIGTALAVYAFVVLVLVVLDGA